MQAGDVRLCGASSASVHLEKIQLERLTFDVRDGKRVG